MRQYIARITKHMLVYKWLHMNNIETCQHEYSFANNETDKHTNVTYSCATNETHIHLHILPARVYLYVYMYIDILEKIYINVDIYKLGLSHTLRFNLYQLNQTSSTTYDLTAVDIGI